MNPSLSPRTSLKSNMAFSTAVCTCSNSAERAEGRRTVGSGPIIFSSLGSIVRLLSVNLRGVVCSYEWGEAITRKYLHEEPDRSTTTKHGWKEPEICKVYRLIIMKTYRRTTALPYSLLYYNTGRLCFLTESYFI